MFRTAVLCLIASCGATCLSADIAFEKQAITERFVAEGCDMADFDKDGDVDITAGNTIWHGPDFKRQTEFTPPANNTDGPTKTPYDPAKGYSDYFLAYAYDVNGDGRNDVITSYDGHRFGLGWFEQNADGSFTERKIMGATPEENAQGAKFSQLHALRLVDMNGDGLLDIVTGKRRWAHGINGDAEPNAPPVLYWFELVRDGKGRAAYVAHQIDDDSGVGTQVTVGDLNKDGRPNVIVANKRGVFAFTQ